MYYVLQQAIDKRKLSMPLGANNNQNLQRENSNETLGKMKIYCY